LNRAQDVATNVILDDKAEELQEAQEEQEELDALELPKIQLINESSAIIADIVREINEYVMSGAVEPNQLEVKLNRARGIIKAEDEKLDDLKDVQPATRNLRRGVYSQIELLTQRIENEWTPLLETLKAQDNREAEYVTPPPGPPGLPMPSAPPQALFQDEPITATVTTSQPSAPPLESPGEIAPSAPPQEADDNAEQQAMLLELQAQMKQQMERLDNLQQTKAELRDQLQAMNEATKSLETPQVPDAERVYPKLEDMQREIDSHVDDDVDVDVDDVDAAALLLAQKQQEPRHEQHVQRNEQRVQQLRAVLSRHGIFPRGPPRAPDSVLVYGQQDLHDVFQVTRHVNAKNYDPERMKRLADDIRRVYDDNTPVEIQEHDYPKQSRHTPGKVRWDGGIVKNLIGAQKVLAEDDIVLQARLNA
jgi:hypothetical protein